MSRSSPSGGVSRERWEYCVFLSFRGEDTRRNFVDHLYAALVRTGISTFMADETLKKGKNLSSELFKAIEDSRIAIVVLSENYASSRWCLEELVKILRCEELKEQIVLPLFYHVEPSDVRKQHGRFGDAFKLFDKSPRVEMWRKALNEVGNLSGWHLMKNGYEATLIEEIVHHISTRLRNASSSIPSQLVGVDIRVSIVEKKLDLGSGGTRRVGIWGMGGSGKTTTARVVYEMLRHRFAACSFITDVGELSKTNVGIATLQKQLLIETLGDRNIEVFDKVDGAGQIRSRLAGRKVLIVIDDVDHLNQLESLADPEWFGSGSRIIITTRDEHLLKASRVDDIYEVELFDEHKALKLFQLCAPRRPGLCGQTYESLSREVVSYCGGLPLALKVLGSFFGPKNVREWRSALNKLKEVPNREILHSLRISYDGLDENEKRVFLYVSCVFEGFTKERVVFFLDGLGLHPETNLQNLMEKCIVNLSGGCVRMHGLLRELGRNIVFQECPREPGKRSILWSSKDIQDALNQNTGTEATESMMLNFSEEKQSQTQWNLKGFSMFTKLKLLMVFGGEAKFFGNLEFLSNEIRILRWDGYPLKSLPSTFNSPDLHGLVLPSSSIQNLRSGGKHFRKLEVIHFSDCKDLTGFPDLSNLPNLRTLDLRGCIRLVEVRSSMPLHERLAHLNLRGCTSLRHLPDAIKFPSLTSFELSGCSRLNKFPEIRGRMEFLKELHLDGTAIVELPPSIKFLVGLVKLQACNCRNLESLPSCIGDLKSLRFVDLSGCPKLKKLPQSLTNLEDVRWRGGDDREVPKPAEDVEDGGLVVPIAGSPLEDASRCCRVM